MGPRVGSATERSVEFISYVERVKGTYVLEESSMSVNANLVVDERTGDSMWDELAIQVIPLRPKTYWWNKQPTAKGVEALRAYQHKWKTSELSFPVIMRVKQGDGYTSELAMVEPSDFLQSDVVLQGWLETARDTGNEWRERALDFVLTAKIGKRPDGSDRPAPWVG